MQHLKPTKKISVIRTFIRNSNIPEFIRKLFYPLVLRHRRFETGSEDRQRYSRNEGIEHYGATSDFANKSKQISVREEHSTHERFYLFYLDPDPDYGD